jgi:arsenite methyltransferase
LKEGVVDMCPVSLALDTKTLAEHYDRLTADRQFRTGQRLVERLNFAPGERVLDVGAGTGLLAEHVAKLVAPSGSVVGVDPLRLRIEIARRRDKRNLTFHVDDAYGLERFPNESFDAVYLNAVLHWLPDKLRPLANLHRVLAPRGRIGITTASREHPNALQRVLSREPYSDYPEAGVPHRVTQRELHVLLETAGFRVQTLELLREVTHHSSIDAVIEHARASSFGNFLRLPSALRAQAREDIETELAALRTSEGIQQEHVRIVAVATKD